MNRESEQDIERTYGIGALLLKKLGHVHGQGLGKEGSQGITKPIETILRPKSAGLGYKDRKDNKRHVFEDIQTEKIIKQEPQSQPAKDLDIPLFQHPLIHNVSSIYNETIRTLQATIDQLKSTTLNMEKLQKDIKSLSIQIDRNKLISSKQEQCKSVLIELEQISKLFDWTLATDHLIKLDDILASDIESQLSIESLNSIYTILGSIIYPILLEYFNTWDILSSPSLDQKESLFFKHLSILCSYLNEHAIPKRAKRQSRMNLYEYIFYSLWLPSIKRSIFDKDLKWKVLLVYHSDDVIARLQCWWTLIPRFVKQALLLEYLFPLFENAIDSWNCNDTILLHHIIIPWLVLFDGLSDIESRLVQMVLNKFHNVLNPQDDVIYVDTISQWHPSDTSVYEWIAPWKVIMNEQQLHSFCQRTIIPSLENVLSNEIDMNHDKNLDELEWILLWKNFIPLSMFTNMFEKILFPLLWNNLYLLMTSVKSYQSIVEWYKGWKTRLGELSSQTTIQQCFRRMLDIMNGILDDPSLSLETFIM